MFWYYKLMSWAFHFTVIIFLEESPNLYGSPVCIIWQPIVFLTVRPWENQEYFQAWRGIIQVDWLAQFFFPAHHKRWLTPDTGRLSTYPPCWLHYKLFISLTCHCGSVLHTTGGWAGNKMTTDANTLDKGLPAETLWQPNICLCAENVLHWI